MLAVVGELDTGGATGIKGDKYTPPEYVFDFFGIKLPTGLDGRGDLNQPAQAVCDVLLRVGKGRRQQVLHRRRANGGSLPFLWITICVPLDVSHWPAK